ncbi:hypothetical protein M3Y97_00812100 [Aphelenchoides bicaudatus]|nr:hypothetical protein M3Y97_00812100 [Aphelenchoides bicaudatus]
MHFSSCIRASYGPRNRASENNNIAFEQVLKVADNLGGTSATMTREKLVIDILSTRIEREIERNLANGRAASKKLVLYTVDGKRPIEIIKDIKAENINIDIDHGTVSKYFRRLSRFVDEERFVIKLIEGKHIACWLNLADKHLKRVVEGLDTYLRNLRFASPRMCLISNSDIMKLLSMETAEDGQVLFATICKLFNANAFRLLRELYLNDDGHLFGVNIDGERVKFENFVPIATLRDEEPQVFVDNIEKTIADFIIQDYVKYTEHRSTIKMSFRLTRVINDFILHQTQDSGFKHVFEEDVLKIHLRGNQLEIPVTPDFIHSAIPAVNVDVHFAHNWALGKIPLFFANITETRSRIQQMCRNLLCSVRFLNCHPGIQSSVFDTIIGACEKGTVLFVLENVDQLPESLYNHLCLCLGRLENECARLILCTTLHATAQQLARHLKVFHSRSILRPESAGDATKPIGAAGLNVSAVTGQKRRISTAKQPPAVNVVKQQVVSSVVAQANRKSDEEELMSTLFGDSINLTNVNFSVCCVGPTAKLLLTDCIERGNAKASWIYIDALTYSQVISAAKEFGEASSGYLIKCLKEAMQVEDQSPRACKFLIVKYMSTNFIDSPPAPQTDRKESLPTTAGTTTTDDSMRRLSVAYKTPKYIIFYGFQQFIQHFPQICSLFYSMSSNVVPEMPPGAYISMSDGSNFYAAKNIRFVLCLPSSNETITSWLNRYEIKTINVSEAIKQPARYFWDKFKVKLEYIVRRGEYLEVVESTMEHLVFPVLDDLKFSDFMEIENMFICLERDIEDAMAFVTIANYGEVLRAATTQCCVNFMITYTTNEIGLLDSKVEEHANSWDRSTSELGKLPFPVSQHKLASLEHIVWEKWIDDAKVKASMKKEYSLSELFVSTTKIERIVNYFVRQFNASDKHFILCGQNYIGKSAIVRRIIKQLEQLLTDYKFIWMDCTGRFDLIEMQNKLSAISLTSKKACLIIDHFCFCESSKALLELYTDHTMLVTHNEPQLCVTDLRLMLVMENEELDKCWAYGEFRKNFHVIPIIPLSEPELNYILERLICWHLNTKTFSSEYLSMVPLLAGASQQIFKIFGKPIDQLIPYIIRLAKGLMFAFPDNTPDLDCMKRLWIHEIIRILYDRELNNEIVQQFLEKLDPILEEFLKTTVEKLFPSREKGDNEDDDFYDKKDAPSWALPDFKLEKLLYSEMAGAESSMDGINYGLARRSDFNKALANLHFEYTNNHSGFEVNLVITDFSSDHCQRLMRVLRQHNENMVLAGHPGCGRHQCVKLATFGVVGLVSFVTLKSVYHAFFDTQTAEAFETSWRNVIIRVINVLASANQPVSVVFHLDYCVSSICVSSTRVGFVKIDKIPIEWLTMLKQWLQRPVIGDLLSDTVIIKMAEKMIESEKTLATLVQSSNIRLPGQRYCQFLSFEAYKNVDLLRNTLEARLADFLHAVFLIPPSHLHLFEWCTADYYKVNSITNGECKTMLDKIAIDCVASNKHRIRDAIDQLFSATKDLIARSEFNCLQFYADSKLLYDLAQSTVVLFNKKHGQLEQRTTLLTTALDTMVQIKELSIIGAHSSLFELTRKLEDAELVMMFLKRTQQEAATELTTLKEKIERLQRDCAVISDKLLQRNAKIGIVLEAPIKDFREASEKLTVYTAADYAKLAKMKTPSLGLKYTIEAVRRAVERGFKPSRNHLDAWLNSIKTLSNKDFCEKVAKFDPNSISATKLKALTEILKNQDIKEQRLIVESPLAADLCKWVKAAQSFANSNKQLKNHRSAASDLSKQLSSKQDQLNTLKDKQQFLARRLISVEREIEQQDRAVHKLNRLIFYRQRGDIVLQALSPLQNRWKTMIGNSKIRLDNLLGNSIIQSAFRVLFGCVNADAKTAIMSKIRSSLIRYNIQYEEKFTAVPTLAIEYFRWISWKEPWPLIQVMHPNITTKRPDLANTLKFFYNDCALLDMSQMAEGWTDREVVDKLLRSSYSDTALIITNVQSSPPAAFYEILLREPDKEKRTVEFMERSILMGENLKLIFLTTHGLSSFEPEFIRIVTPIKLEEQFDMKDGQLGGESLFPTEEDLLKQLTNYSAIDILETEDVTNQIIQLAESIPLS